MVLSQSYEKSMNKPQLRNKNYRPPLIFLRKVGNKYADTLLFDSVSIPKPPTTWNGYNLYAPYKL